MAISDEDIISTADRLNKAQLDFQRKKWADTVTMLYRVGSILKHVLLYVTIFSIAAAIIAGLVTCNEASEMERQEEIQREKEAMDSCVQALDADTCLRVRYSVEEGKKNQRAAYEQCLEAVGAEICDLIGS